MNKYAEITSEFAIRGTYCNLAVKLEQQLQMLIEVKAIGLDLKDAHLKQAVDYAANQGVEWVALTNGAIWRVYRVSFTKPITHELVVEFDFSQLNPKSDKDIESVFLICKEGWGKSVLGEYHNQRQTVNRFFLAGLIQSEPVLQVIRRELRRLLPEIKIEIDDICELIASEVLKRDVLEGDLAEAAKKKINKAANKLLRERGQKESGSETDAAVLRAEPSSASETPVIAYPSVTD